jgi:two-component system, sensor histidine kinase and response regulator
LEIQQKIEGQIVIFADWTMIDTIIRNHINNAIKFTEEASIRIEAFQDKNYTKVGIIDSGVGIEPCKLNKIFDVTGSKSTIGTQGEAGSGLGLLLCKEFIEKHDGIISVQSEPGIGSTFRITIPNKPQDSSNGSIY